MHASHNMQIFKQFENKINLERSSSNTHSQSQFKMYNNEKTLNYNGSVTWLKIAASVETYMKGFRAITEPFNSWYCKKLVYNV